MVKKKYTKDEIQTAILRIFDIQKDAADLLGDSETNFTNKIKRGSNKFIKQLGSVGIVFDSPIVKEQEVEYAGMTLVKQVKLLEETNERLDTELRKLKYELLQLKKDCGHKEDCLIKNIEIENETDD